jgi:hypothetical protein
VSLTVYLRVADRHGRCVLLESFGLLVAFLLTAVTRAMGSRPSACAICIRKLRLSLRNYVKRLFLFEKARVTFIFLHSLPH